GWLARRENPHAREAVFLACWVLAPLAFFSFNHSKLPQYVLPLMPAIALAAARAYAREGMAFAWRASVVTAVALGLGLVSLTRWMPSPISLTPASRAAIPPAALILGLTLLVAAGLVAVGVRRGQETLGAALRDTCAQPTVFVFRANDRDRRAAMTDLPLLYEDGRYAAYGPCRSIPGRG